ncbi:type IV secretion system DNA-binding domain-containing protein [Arthrobacter sp. EpRS71]|uniref:type IV secretory system conjugative DNA transfer family protein n=1 Tax=Arthrobacter sp. EpRS71 TaxID=1743141 RepID=UPI00074754C2|nr:type IV secretion system DNA-binding domain-containing protein [Arthrobacter sp. EpRS71]KUM39030.1 hypothetical protein AR689_07700 [Arthrobacter sp. EpRS71]
MTPLTQSVYDNDRRSYLLTFPGDLDEKRVLAWLSSISGNMHVGLSRIFGVPSIVFETFANDQGITHRLRVPSKDAHYVVSHLESLVPGVNVSVDDKGYGVKWTVGVELGMKQPSRTLRVASTTDFSASVLTSIQSLRENEAVVIQWVLSPAPFEAPPQRENKPASNDWSILRALLNPGAPAGSDEIDDRRRKLETPNMLAVGRIAVAAPHEIRANKIAGEVMHAFAEAKVGRNWLTQKQINPEKLAHTIGNATTPMLFPAQLNLPEATSFISWPVGSPYIAGLPQSRTRHMHVTNVVPREGTVIGTSTVPGSNRDIAIDRESRLQHVHIMGPTKSGKTWLSTNMAVQDMNDGSGLVLIDPKGDLYQRVLERVPAHRMNDVIVWDLDDTDFPIGFNVLRQGSSRAAIDELNGLITNLFPESLSAPQVMYHGLHALAGSGTFVDLPSMIKPTPEEEAWQRKVVRNIEDTQIKKFWQEYLNESTSRKGQQQSRADMELGVLLRRIWPFVSRSEIRNSLGQLDSTFTMPDLVSNNKILLVNLNGVRIGQQAASLMGTLIMNALWGAVRTTPHTAPVMLYMDEFQNFVALPTDPADMLAQSRSFGLGMVLAHQNLTQLTNKELKDAVLANCRSKIVFQTTAKDAKAMSPEFGPQVRAEDLQNLRHRETISRVATADGVSQAFTMRTKEAFRETGNIRQVIQQSRARYGRPLAEVEQEIDTRRTGPSATPEERPNIGRRKIS